MTLLKQVVAIVVLLLPISMHAQEKITAQPVSLQSVPSLSHIFKKYALFEINTAALDQYMKQGGQGNIRLELTLPGFATFPMNLQAHDILSNNYKLVVGTPQGRQVFSKPACMTYQGILTNQGSSQVSLTITNDLIYGMLGGSSQSWFIEPLQYFDKQASANVYVVYDTRDVLPRTDVSCGVSEIQTRQATNNNTARVEGTATGTCKMVEVAIASDDAMLLRYGSAVKVQQHNIAVMNVVVGVYSNAQFASQYLEFRIAGQYVSAASANNALLPLTTTDDAGVLLSNFQAWGNAGNFGFTYDEGVYWTPKDITYMGSGATIGLASVGAICTSFRYQVLEDLASLDGAQLGSMAAHETGHNFGAQHDAQNDPYIMAPFISNPPNMTFSPISITAINIILAKPATNCLSACNAIMPIAQFNASTPNVCTGSSITFTDYSVGQVSGVSWTFQDGTPATSTNRSETVSFSSPGIKTIKLTATNANGTNTVTKTVFVGAPLSGAGCRTGTSGGAGYGAFYNFLLQNAKYSASVINIGSLYKDLTCSSTTLLLPNTTYTGSTTIGLDFPPTWDYTSNMQLFIDYNNDGDFLDAGENVYTSGVCTKGSLDFNFTTPAVVPVSDAYLRMRAVSTPCTVTSTNGCAIPPNSHVLDFGVFFSSAVALPLLLTSFDGYYNNGKNELNWTTETEVETDHFIVERSTDGNTYVEVGNMPAKGLTNTLTNYYQFTDASLNTQTVNRFYYRLKMVDKNGAFTYSKSVVITRPNESGRVQVLVYPNPVLRNTTLQIKKATNELSVIEIFNSMGQKVYAKRLTAALYNTTVDIPGNWSAGIYIIRITDKKESWSGSVLIK